MDRSGWRYHRWDWLARLKRAHMRCPVCWRPFRQMTAYELHYWRWHEDMTDVQQGPTG